MENILMPIVLGLSVGLFLITFWLNIGKPYFNAKHKDKASYPFEFADTYLTILATESVIRSIRSFTDPHIPLIKNIYEPKFIEYLRERTDPFTNKEEHDFKTIFNNTTPDAALHTVGIPLTSKEAVTEILTNCELPEAELPVSYFTTLIETNQHHNPVVKKKIVNSILTQNYTREELEQWGNELVPNSEDIFTGLNTGNRTLIETILSLV